MKEYQREYPFFSLCGLNCGLCPRYHTEGISRCPGCGGDDFYLKHPTCAVITCNKKHDFVEYCFSCTAYPCEKYKRQSNLDSFISYQNVLSDLQKAGKDLKQYQRDLQEKMDILTFLLKNYNDGKRKNFYCLAINLLDLADVKEIMVEINAKIGNLAIDRADKIKRIVLLFEAKAKQANIVLKLRK